MEDIQGIIDGPNFLSDKKEKNVYTHKETKPVFNAKRGLPRVMPTKKVNIPRVYRYHPRDPDGKEKWEQFEKYQKEQQTLKRERDKAVEDAMNVKSHNEVNVLAVRNTLEQVEDRPVPMEVEVNEEEILNMEESFRALAKRYWQQLPDKGSEESQNNFLSTLKIDRKPVNPVQCTVDTPGDSESPVEIQLPIERSQTSDKVRTTSLPFTALNPTPAVLRSKKTCSTAVIKARRQSASDIRHRSSRGLFPPEYEYTKTIAP